MRDPNRIKRILAALEAKWQQHPDFRLGQLLIAVVGAHPNYPDLFYVEDSVIEENLGMPPVTENKATVVADAAAALVASGYDGPFMGEAVAELIRATIAYSAEKKV